VDNLYLLYNDDEVFSKLTHDDLISTIKDLLKNVHGKTNKYNVLHKLFKELRKKEVTLNQETESSEKENHILKTTLFDVPCNYNSEKYTYAFQEFLYNSIERSKLASMIYGERRNKRKGIGYIEDEQEPKVHTLDNPKHVVCSNRMKR
jgi:hypothetical protein